MVAQPTSVAAPTIKIHLTALFSEAIFGFIICLQFNGRNQAGG